MKKRFLPALLGVFLISGCGIQSIPRQKNAVEAALAEVTNQYKRRADLIPNLVAAVKGYAKHEKDVFTQVTEARAKATSMVIDPSNATPEQISAYANAQGQLSQALGRLLVAAERYPELKADASFKDLHFQLEGAENRITVARQRLIESIKQFNDLVTVFPTSFTNSLFFHHPKMAQWDLSPDEKKAVEKAPEVKF